VTIKGETKTVAEITRVSVDRIPEDRLLAYVESGDPMDKAGSYAIQGTGGMFIDRIEGSYSNVVGLPMTLLRDMLYQMKSDV